MNRALPFSPTQPSIWAAIPSGRGLGVRKLDHSDDQNKCQSAPENGFSGSFRRRRGDRMPLAALRRGPAACCPCNKPQRWHTWGQMERGDVVSEGTPC